MHGWSNLCRNDGKRDAQLARLIKERVEITPFHWIAAGEDQVWQGIAEVQSKALFVRKFSAAITAGQST